MTFKSDLSTSLKWIIIHNNWYMIQNIQLIKIVTFIQNTLQFNEYVEKYKTKYFLIMQYICSMISCATINFVSAINEHKHQ
jgi:hypothetical protein